MARYLIVANQTLEAAPLIEKVRECMAAEPVTFHVVVPATHPRDHSSWTEGGAHALAQGRLDAALARFREMGAEVDGEVGDASAMLAIRDALLADSYDGVILSTLPPGISRWLKQDLPHRLERNLGVKVTHVVAKVATVA